MFGFDLYQREELEPSWATQLDTVGMQPHAREYLEQEMISGQMIDYSDGIQFTGKP
jgi:hypothetical protein